MTFVMITGTKSVIAPTLTTSPSPTPQPVKQVPHLIQLILNTATKHDIDGERFLETARCESSLKPGAIGDHGTSYGLFQIHLPAHPSVSIEQALDPYFVVEWSAKKFKANPKIWSCYKKLYGR